MNNEEYKDITYEVKESKVNNKVLKKYSGKKTRKKVIVIIVILFLMITGFSFYYILKNTDIISFKKDTSNIVINRKLDKNINVVYDKQYNNINNITINSKTDNKYINSNSVDHYREYYLIGDEKALKFILVKFKKDTDFVLNEYILYNKNILLSTNNLFDYKEKVESSTYVIVSYSQVYDFSGARVNEYIKYKNKKLYILISENYDLIYSKKIFDIFVNNN